MRYEPGSGGRPARPHHVAGLRKADEILKVKRSYGDNPPAKAKRLRALGLSSQEIRQVHAEHLRNQRELKQHGFAGASQRANARQARLAATVKLGPQAEPAGKAAKPLTHREQLGIAANVGLQRSGIESHALNVGLSPLLTHPRRTAKNLGKQLESVPAELGPALLTAGGAVATDVYRGATGIRHPLRRPKPSAVVEKVIKPTASRVKFLVSHDPIVVRIDKNGQKVYRAKGGGETSDRAQADTSVGAKMSEYPLDYALFGRGAALGVGKAATLLRPHLALPKGRLELEARTGRKFTTALSPNPVRRAEQQSTRALTTGVTRGIENTIGRELPIVGEHARAVRLGAKQSRRAQRVEVQRATAPFQRAFKPLNTDQKIAVVLHAKGVKPSELRRHVQEQLDNAKAGVEAERKAGRYSSVAKARRSEMRDHERMLKFLSRTSDATYARVMSDARLAAARGAAKQLSDTGGDILQQVGKLTPLDRELRKYLTARVVGGARFVETPAVKARPAQVREYPGQPRTITRLGEIPARSRTVTRPRTVEEAQTRLAELDKKHEKIIGTIAATMKEEMGGKFSAAETGRRNLANRALTGKAGKRAQSRAKLQAEGGKIVSQSEELRAAAEQRLQEVLQRNPQQAKRFGDLEAEREALRNVLNEQAISGEPAGPALGNVTKTTKAGTTPELGTVTETIPGKPRRVHLREIKAQQRQAGFVGGPPLEDLKARLGAQVFYHPDVGKTLREGRQAPQQLSGAGPPRVPGITKQNRAVRLMTSRWLPTPQAWQDSYLAAVGYAHAVDRGRLAHSVARDLNPDGSVNRGWRYVNLDGVKLKGVKDQQALSQHMDEFLAGDGNLEKFIDDTLATKSSDTAARWHAEGKRVAQISPSDYRQIFGEFQGSNVFIRNVLDRPTDFWRALTLNYRPAWVVNNFVGQTFLYAINHATPGGAAAYARAVLDEGRKSGRYYPEDLRYGLFQSEATQAGAMAGGRTMTGALQGARNAERAMREKINAVNSALSDNVPRRAAWYAVAKQHNNLLNRIDHTNRTFDEFLQQLEKAGNDPAGDPALRTLHDDMVQQVLDELIDFGDLSQFERAAIRRVIPFYSWLKGITKATVRLGLNRPLTTAYLATLSQSVGKDELRRWMGAGEETLQNFLPLSVQKGPAGRVATGISTVGLNPEQSVSDVTRMIRGGLSAHPTSPFDNPANAMAPWAQSIIEGVSRKDLFSGKTLSAPGGIAGIMAEQYVKGFPQYSLGQQLISPRPELGKNNRPVLSPGGGSIAGIPFGVARYLGLPITHKNLDRAAQITEQNRLAAMPKSQQLDDKYKTFAQQLRAALDKTGSELTPELQWRLQARQERALQDAQAGRSAVDHYAGDVTLLVRYKSLSAGEAKATIRWARSLPDNKLNKQKISNARAYLTRHYFDPGGMLAESVTWLRKNGSPDLVLP
jgi:hypothetical protein